MSFLIFFLIGYTNFFATFDAFALETAKVLPKGVRRIWVIGIESNNVDRRYNNNGEMENIVHDFNKTLTMKDFQRSEPKLKTLVENLNQMQNGLGDSLESYSNIYNQFTIKKRIVIPSFQYGITDRFTLGIRTEITRRIAKNKIYSESFSNSNQVLAQLGNKQSIPANLLKGLETLQTENLMPEFITYRMYTYKGYVSPQDFDRTDIGDTEIGGKYKLWWNDFIETAIQSRIIIPTGKERPLNNPYDPGSGIGTWGSSLEYYLEYSPISLLTFSASTQGRYYLPDTKTRAVPMDADDNLPSLRPEDGQLQTVRRKLGKELRSEFATIFNIPGDTFKIWGAAQNWLKEKDHFNGPGNLYYEGLSKNTSYSINTWELGARLSTIRMFYQKKFRAPLELDTIFNSTFSGKNIREASYARMDLKLYF